MVHIPSPPIGIITHLISIFIDGETEDGREGGKKAS
jgi:hypothetical protein